MENDMGLADAVKKARSSKGISQTELAEKIGISQNAYSKMERGETTISLKRLLEISKALEVNYMDIMKFVTKNEFEANEHYIMPIKDSIKNELEKVYSIRIADLEKIISSQSETILLLKEKINNLEQKK